MGGGGGVLLMSSLLFFFFLNPTETVLSCSSEFALITGSCWEMGTTGWGLEDFGKAPVSTGVHGFK